MTDNTPKDSKSVIAPPKRRQQSFGLDRLQAQAPAAADNMVAAKEVNMTFRVTEDFHFRFKSTASLSRKSMKEILMEGFDLWVEKNDNR